MEKNFEYFNNKATANLESFSNDLIAAVRDFMEGIEQIDKEMKEVDLSEATTTAIVLMMEKNINEMEKTMERAFSAFV